MDAIEHVDNLAAYKIGRNHLSLTNQLTNFHRLSLDEVFIIPDLADGSGTGRRSMLHMGQKSVKVMQRIVRKLAKPSDTILDIFAGTVETTKVCLLLTLHSNFIAGDYGEECVGAEQPYAMNTFALMRSTQFPTSNVTMKYGEVQMCS